MPEKSYKSDKTDLIIPVYRPDDKLWRLLDMIDRQTSHINNIYIMQTLTDDDEIDRGLSDRLMGRGAIVTTLHKKTYDHGGTRNKGASLSDAGRILFMTQDAVPKDEYLVERLLKALSQEGVATAYARQLATDEAGPIESYTRVFNYPEESSIKSKEDVEKIGIKAYFCSNVCAMYDHEVYDEIGGFVRHTIFNEDSIMAAKTIEAGYSIAYAADAEVYHAHKYTFRQYFSRNFDLAVSQKQYSEIFDKVSSESEGVRLVMKTAKHLTDTDRWYLLPELVIGSGCKYAGYFLGKRYRSLPKEVTRALSMNKAYWK